MMIGLKAGLGCGGRCRASLYSVALARTQAQAQTQTHAQAQAQAQAPRGTGLRQGTPVSRYKKGNVR